MADKKCSSCGRKIGGVFGQSEPSKYLLDRASELGITHSGECHVCFASLVDQHQPDLDARLRVDREQAERTIKAAMSKMLVTPAQPSGGKDLGVVSGYSVIGTGVISEITSSFTDFFGMQSDTYLGKIRKAEEFALNMLKLEAFRKGGDSIYCYSISLTEATSGKGMLMVSTSGAAVISGVMDEDIAAAIKALSIPE